MNAENQTLPRAVVAEATGCFHRSAETIRHCLEQLTDEQVWWRPCESMNSTGNLVLHLCGNVRQWIVSALGGAADTRDRPKEFTERQKIPKAELLARLDAVITDAAAALDRLTSEELMRIRPIQGRLVSGVRAIFGAVTHFQGHTQEIVHLTRMQLGDGYRFAGIPPENAAGRAGP